MKKYIYTVLIFLFTFPVIVRAQELNTIKVTDWNTLRKSGFYEGLTSDAHNSPGNRKWYWGINVGHTGNTGVSTPYHYNGQILFSVATAFPEVYVRSTSVTGEGLWAKVLHSKGDQAIDGKLTVKEVQITINTGADYVFSPDYNLPSLSEVETFVQENQHLPDIPSEKQMQEEGLNVNDMQIKLLQKIEELTLYTIQQQKQLEEQSAQIKQLQSVIQNK